MKKNFIYNLLYQFVQIVIPLILLPYVSRVLGADILGVYNYSYTIASYFLIFGMLGVANYGCRSIAEVQDDFEKRSKVFSSIYIVQFCFSLSVLVIYLAYVVIFVRDNKVIALIQTFIVMSGTFDINWFYFGIEKFKLTVTRNIAIKIITTLLVFIFVKKPSDLILYTGIYAVGLFISQSIVWIFLKKYIKFSKVKLKDVLVHIKPIILLFVPVLAISLYKYMDKIMLGILCEYSQVAYYTNSESIISIPAIITTALGTVALPRLTSLNAKGKKEISEHYLEISLQFAMFLACGMAFGLGAVSDIFVQLYFGSGYESCAVLMVAFFPCVIFQAWASIIRMQYLLPNSHDRIYVLSVVVGAVINLFMNIMLIPSLQAVGAVIGTIVAEFMVATIQTAFCLKYLPIKKYLKTTGYYVVIGFFMFLIIDLMKRHMDYGVLTLITCIFLGGGLYAIISMLVNWRTKSSLYSCISQMLRQKNNC
ncbi:flippase [Ruminococcus bicirculans (ex Wegman et al. 2014)]|uniref:flippase n=1 Tax=Ruminococcus bicirculans (ex Wegman et al. 2014) TaxID=1160721 RepID=UPI002673A94B